MLDNQISGKGAGIAPTAQQKKPSAEKLQVNVSVNNTNTVSNKNEVAQTTIISLPEKLNKFAEMQRIVNQRANLAKSLEEIKTFIADADPEKGIKFSFGDISYSYRKGDGFVTGNTNLVGQLLDFLKGKFEEQLKISDAKLLEATV